MSHDVHDSQRPVILIGAGDHARVLLDLLRVLNRRVLFLTDHNPEMHGRSVGGVPVRGDDRCILDHEPRDVALVNGVGSVLRPQARQMVYERFRDAGYCFAQLIHPSAILAESVSLGEGAQVMAGAVLQTGVVVGDNALVNTRASVDHDCVIGRHVHVAPGVTLSGRVSIGDTSHIGTGASIIQGVTVGKDAVVAAGAVVVRSVSDDVMVRGVPARVVGSPGDDRSDFSRQDAFNIMISAAGRRVALLRLARRSIKELGLRGGMLGTDITPISSALHDGDDHRLVKPYADPECLEQMLAICEELNLKLIVPTIDPELPFYAEHRGRFADVGTTVMVSDPETIRIANDKQATHEWLMSQGFPTPRQAPVAVLLENLGDWAFPFFVKMRHGSSSTGATVVRDLEHLHAATSEGEFIAQTLAPGKEFTVDVFIDRAGKCRCAVPRRRLETRGGEVSKGVTVRHQAIEALACRVAEALPGGRGVMNIQIFYDHATRELQVIEINPRFGGGYPLSHEAGAPMVRWVIEEALGRPCTASMDCWRDGVVMLRFDDAVFIDRDRAGLRDEDVLA